MRISARLAAAGVMSVCLLGGTAGAATAATVTTGPVPVVQATTEGWHNPSVRLSGISVGQGGSPFVNRLHWTHWNATSAWASGELWMIKNSSCTPLYKCPYTHRWVAVTLSRAVHHGAKLFYTRMRWVSCFRRASPGGPVGVRRPSWRLGPWVGPVLTGEGAGAGGHGHLAVPGAHQDSAGRPLLVRPGGVNLSGAGSPAAAEGVCRVTG